MKIALLCSDRAHLGFAFLEEWVSRNSARHQVTLHDRAQQLTEGDFLFLISCTEIIPATVYTRFRFPLVIHESDLPHGRGWSPLAWQILEGRHEIAVSLIEVSEHVDRGAIWKKSVLRLQGHELLDEINQRLMQVKFELVEYALAHHAHVERIEQKHTDATYYKRRTPEQSELDPRKSIESQFDLLRIADARRYPAFFTLRGHRYKLVVEKMD